jgi:glycosyltransferase involved in cell wall biosynthesis
MLQGTQGVKQNGWVSNYATQPNNHQLLPKTDNPLQAIPNHFDIDFFLGQHRFGQAQTALQLGHFFSCPTIILEHTTVTNPQLEAARPQLKQIRGDINVFISESSALAWDWDLNDESVTIIHHGVDSKNLFKPYSQLQKGEPYILSIVNDWVNRGDLLGWDIYNRVVVNNKLPCRILGDNAGISKPAKNVFELVQEYNHAGVFYNTSRFSPIPSTLLEAMSCGLPVVSTDNFLISEIIVDGVNGYKTNSEAEQLRHLQRLLTDKEEREELGRNARKTIMENFKMEDFTRNWNNVFDRAAKIRKY